MKIKATVLLTTLSLFSFYSFGQKGDWSKLGAEWTYDLTKKTAGQDSVGGDNLSFTSNAGSETFLPAPSSGSAMVSSTKGNPSFIHTAGANASVKIRAANQPGSPTKFAVYGIKEATPIAAISFTLTPNHQAKQTDWYFVLGRDANLFKDPATILPISRTGSSPNGAVAVSLRVQSNETFGEHMADKYRMQHRQQPELEDDITWGGSNNTLFTKGNKHEVEIYTNNTLGEQTYSLNGADYKLSGRTYHLWIGGKKIGGDFQLNAIRRNQPIDAFLFMSRDAVEGSVGGTNASTLEISNLKIKYGSR